MTGAKVPTGLSAGGRDLWKSITDDHPDLDAGQLVTLLEVCRSKDRLDKLDAVLRGDVDTWISLNPEQFGDGVEVKVTAALAQANATANLLKQLIAALRLPDVVSGKRPQQRGGGRGAYSPTAKPATKVSSIDRARARKSG